MILLLKIAKRNGGRRIARKLRDWYPGAIYHIMHRGVRRKPIFEDIYEKYPNIWELQCCIREFRNIFKNHNVPMLYLFVEKYSKNLLKPLRSFAEGLKRDIDAVENAVAYDYSNGFVEGTNSRLKMIKRTMYGRCGRQLLEAKLRYMGYNNNNG